ncbi:hypothetical protein GF360_03545 [candidate division WWE3 bacterium]|nr:hypothetical protein [candidate division WWE3 bacterium]
MSVKFIRHYKYLEKPFDDWTEITLEQYNDLASGKIDPTIRKDFNIYLAKNYTKSSFDHYDLFLTSNLRRCIDTGNGIKETFQLKVPIIESKYLEEVFWSPKSMINKKAFIMSQKSGKLDLYDQRLSQFMSGRAPKDISDTFKQLRSLENLLSERRKTNILCITHSFLLKMISLYFIDHIKDESHVTLEMLKGLRTREIEVSI